MSKEEDMIGEKPVLCAGEILCDFISKETGKGLGHSSIFEKRPGGSPFNIAVGLRRLGIRTTFLSKVGGDQFGLFLAEYLENERLITDCLVISAEHKTTLAFAAVDSDGKPEFTFYRDKDADSSLAEGDIEEIAPGDFTHLHFGSISLLQEPAASTYLRLFERFRNSGVPISFDPNVRPSMVSDKESYIKMVRRIISGSNIVKLSDDDLQFLVERDSVKTMAEKLPIKDDGLLVVTKGKQGAGILFKNNWTEIPGISVKIAETTGCGDSFMAGLISEIMRENADFSRIERMVTFANACAALVATRIGAANAMPYRQEVLEFLERRGCDF